MTLSIATWNINSVRLRQALVARFLEAEKPDVLCLQETKCPQGQFPSAIFSDIGYSHIAEAGQSGYNGVAIIARIPFEDMAVRQFCGKDDCRHIQARFGSTTVHNLYVPSGGDVADPAANEKFAHKLSFLSELETWFSGGTHSASGESVVVGDLNIAPYEHDVWSHKELLKIVSHTPVETRGLERVREAGGFVDVMRRHVPLDQKLYTWWSYRAKDWEAADRGRRLDHVWATPGLAARSQGISVLKDARRWTQTSDHAPVIARFGLAP